MNVVRLSHKVDQGVRITSPEGDISNVIVRDIKLKTRNFVRKRETKRVVVLRQDVNLEVRAEDSNRRYSHLGESMEVNGVRIVVDDISRRDVEINYHLPPDYQITAGRYYGRGRFRPI